MKKTKIKELTTLLTLTTGEKLTKSEMAFYNRYKFRFSGGVHVAVLKGPLTEEQRLMIDRLDQKLRLHTIILHIKKPNNEATTAN
jgi:hypothetical protein